MQRVHSDQVVYYQFDDMCGPSLRHGIFTRLGGYSQGPWAELNVGHTVGDDLAAVKKNHHLLYEALGIADPDQIVTAHQVHGNRVACVGAEEGGEVMPATDALITATPGVICMLRFADCMPVLFYDPVYPAVGLAHAGWRGTVKRIAAHTIEAMRRAFDTDPADLVVGLGPSIRSCCYQVGDEVIDAVASELGDPDGLLVEKFDGSYHFDLAAANLRQLEQAGVTRVEVAPFCTACRVDAFYSHRAEGGHTGRFAALVGLRDTGR